MDKPSHVSVMVDEIKNIFPLTPGGVYIDGTLGLGGHALAFSDDLKPGGLIVGFDWDKKMLEVAKNNLSSLKDVQVICVNSKFATIPEKIEELLAGDERRGNVQGILLDLGLNNAQIESIERGFSFKEDAPLDMRMDQASDRLSAAQFLNRSSAKEIEDVLFHYGDERWARKIAHVIVERRKASPLVTTADLVDCVLAAIPAAKRDKRIHPATRTFQAVRIAVNNELEELSNALEKLAQLLCTNGVLAVLSYHSGEDRIVKHLFRDLSDSNFEVIFKKPLIPTESERANNPKSRSAKLRAIRKK
jgi:16S rRNA (cytosine1402-N4)-methyltransferase